MAKFKEGDRVIEIPSRFGSMGKGTVEWCEDDPKEPQRVRVRFDRGGTWVMDIRDIRAANAEAARNADTPEGRRIIERAKGRFAAIKDPGQLANVRDDILRGISRSSAIPDDEKDALEGEVMYLHGQALRKLGFNAVRSRNAVVQKALNAAARNAKFRVFLDNGRETEIVETSEASASDKVLQKFKFWGDKAPKVSRVVRLKPVVSGRFVGKANGLEYYVDYTDDLGFAKKYGKDGTNVTEIHISTPYLKDEDGRERKHIVYTWSRGREWIGDKFKHPDFPDAARAARDLAAKLIRSNPNVAKIGDDTNDWR